MVQNLTGENGDEKTKDTPSCHEKASPAVKSLDSFWKVY